MHPLMEYAFTAGGLALGYKSGGYLGTFLIMASVAAGIRLYMQGGQCRSTRRLDGKTVVITGSNTGIGKITALDMVKRGAKVIMLCRDLSRAEPAAEDIRSQVAGAEVVVMRMDLASLDSIKECVDSLKKTVSKVDILINNAGVMMCPMSRTKDGFEMQIGTNHFGHFYLTILLMPLIKKSGAGARIVNVSSLAHTRGKMMFDDINWERTPYDTVKAYGQSKLANVLFTRELAKRLAGTGVNVYSLHPGVIATELGRHVKDSMGSLVAFLFTFAYPFIKTPESGAQTSIFCAVDESVADQTGLYYSDCAIQKEAPQALSDEDAKKLWDISEKLTGVKF